VSVAVAVSVTDDRNVVLDEIESVAVAVSVTGALNVLAATAPESVAVAVSSISALKILLPSDENGACENVDRPNTRHAPLILSCCQISFSKPALLRMAFDISPLNQVGHVAIFIHAHRYYRALWIIARQLYGIAFFKCCHD